MNDTNVAYPEEFKPELTQWQSRAYDASLISSPATTRLPQGFFINWTTIASVAAIVGTMCGLWLYTYATADAAGYQRAKAEDAQIKQQETIDEQARKLAENEKLLKMFIKETK